MPATVKGGVELRKALRNFAPELGKETQKEIASVLKPVVKEARGFVTQSPLSNWAREGGKFPVFNASIIKRGIGYKTTPSKPNRRGFRALAQIRNMSAAGAIYEGLRRQFAKLRRLPDPGPADTSKMLPFAYSVAILLIGLSMLLLYVDVVNPVRLGG